MKIHFRKTAPIRVSIATLLPLAALLLFSGRAGAASAANGEFRNRAWLGFPAPTDSGPAFGGTLVSAMRRKHFSRPSCSYFVDGTANARR